MTTTAPTVVATRYGPAALAALCEVVAAAKEDDALAPVTVIVPNNFVGIAARRALAGGQHGAVHGGATGLIGVDFLTTHRLAELIGAPALAHRGRRPVSGPVVGAAVRRVLAEEPGIFAPVASHPTTERRLVSAHRELAEVSDHDRRVLAAQSPRAHDVVRIHQRVTELLSDQWYSEQDLVRVATDIVGDDGATLPVSGPIVVHLPQDIPPTRARLLTALSQRLPLTIVAGRTGDPQADATIVASLDRLGCRLPDGSAPHGDPPTVQFTSVSDADDEVRHVVRGIIEAAQHGTSFDRMAVVYAADNPYSRLLHDQLHAAGIPFNGADVTTLATSTAGRFLRRLLDLPERDFRREDVAALLAGAPLRWRGGWVPSRAWEQLSRDAGVVRGREDWQHRLGTHIGDLEEDIAALTGDADSDWRIDRLRRRVERAQALIEYIAELGSDLDRARLADSWRARTAWCRNAIRNHLGDLRDWPEAERRAMERIEGALDRLAGLDSVEPSPSVSVFRRTLDLELDSGLGRVGSFGNGVLVGPAWMTIGLELHDVWILGLSEGTFPSRPRDDSLLPDRERATVPDLRRRRDQIGNQHRHFLAALAAVGVHGTAHLLRPRGDLRQSDERAPSRWLVDLAEARTGTRPAGADLDLLDEDWVTHVPSFAGGIVAASVPGTEQEYELKSLADLVDTGAPVDQHPLVATGSLGAGHLAQQARDGSRFTRFDGNLAGCATLGPAAREARPLSATALETWAKCPHQYFMARLLGVEPLDPPELRLRIDPLSRGSLIHEVLERFVEERTGFTSSGYGWSADDRERLHRIADEAFERARTRGLTGEPIYWRRDQALIRRDLDAFFDTDHHRRIDGRLRPVDTELPFGLRDAKRVEIALPNHRTIELRGSIDLVDEDETGGLVVIDYKTGRKYKKLTADDPHHGGTRLQLVLYAVAARSILGRPDAPVRSTYWFLRSTNGDPQVGYDVTPEVERAVLGAVARIVEGIERGVFPQHPIESTRTRYVDCHYCDPDGLGVGEARRRFLRKAGAPELEDYVALAEPDLVPQHPLPHLGSSDE